MCIEHGKISQKSPFHSLIVIYHSDRELPLLLLGQSTLITSHTE